MYISKKNAHNITAIQKSHEESPYSSHRSNRYSILLFSLSHTYFKLTQKRKKLAYASFFLYSPKSVASETTILVP